MRHTIIIAMIFSCLGLRAQQGLIVTTAGDSILIEYSKIRLVQAPTRAATATILYDLSYIRFNIRASFGAFTAAADCNLFSFQDPTGKWFAVPISSIDQVKKKTGADNGYIFSEIEGARQDVVYEFQDDFWEVRDTLVACAQALSGSFPGVATDMSVTGNGTAGGPIKFVNDEETPGDDMYYGTDTSGVKGWYNLPVGGGGWWLTEDGDTMHVGTGQFVNMRDSGIITILFDTLTREMTFYAVSTPTDFGSGVNGDMAIWNGATLTSKTDAQFIWENNLPYGQGTANTMTYWVNDTLLGATAITYSATQWNAAALTGSLRLATGTTAERPGTPVIGDLRLNTTLGDLEFYNGTVWRSLAESMNGTGTPFELAIYNAAGALGDTTFAALLSAASGVTGSGASPRVAYWSGAGTLTSDANFLWDGQLSVGTTNSVYTLDVGTGGARLAPGANPVGAAGVTNFLTGDWFQGHNGTAYYYFARSDDVDPGAGRLWFQNSANTAMTTSSNITYDATHLHFTGGDIEIETANRGIMNSAGNVGIEFNTSNPYIYAELGGSGSERYMEFEGPSARIGRMFQPSSAPSGFPLDVAFGIEAQAYSGFDGQDTYIVSERAGSSNATNIRLIAANASDANNGGSIFIQPGGSITNGSYTGLSGVFQINVPVDKDTIRTIPWKAVEVSGRNKLKPTIHLFHLDTTQTAIKTLFLEGDTVKYRIENIGVISTSTDGSGDVTVTHGMGTTPTYIDVQPTGTTPWITSIHTIGGTTFKVRFYDAAGAAVTSTAVTATWLGKT